MFSIPSITTLSRPFSYKFAIEDDNLAYNAGIVQPALAYREQSTGTSAMLGGQL